MGSALLLVILLGAAIGFRDQKQNHPKKEASDLVSQYVEGMETPPPVVSPSPLPEHPAMESKLSDEDQKKFTILKEILKTKNDNDPRFDRELLHLSPELKKMVEHFYGDVKPELRNERGTVVFLIGRDLNSQDDVNFLKDVMMEKPCMSLADCSKAETGGGAEAHLDAINETTANYPQLMALRQLLIAYQKSANGTGQAAIAESIAHALQAAAHSPNPRVAREAQKVTH